MQFITDPSELCLSLVVAIVEQVADAAAASTGEHLFEIEALLLTRLMQDLPQQIEAAKAAAKMRTENGP
jgi:hypothetical protein